MCTCLLGSTKYSFIYGLISRHISGFMLHCQHGSSLDILDNPPSFCQLSSDCLLCSTTPLVLSSRINTY